MLFAYFGPETFLPLTSVIAGVVGVVLMFGKNIFRILLLPFSKASKPGREIPPGSHATPPAPHIGQIPSALEKRRAQAAAGRQPKQREEAGD